jgi:hypothetical protein
MSKQLVDSDNLGTLTAYANMKYKIHATYSVPCTPVARVLEPVFLIIFTIQLHIFCPSLYEVLNPDAEATVRNDCLAFEPSRHIQDSGLLFSRSAAKRMGIAWL